MAFDSYGLHGNVIFSLTLLVCACALSHMPPRAPVHRQCSIIRTITIKVITIQAMFDYTDRSAVKEDHRIALAIAEIARKVVFIMVVFLL